MCQCGTVTKIASGVGPAKKPATVMTNAPRDAQGVEQEMQASFAQPYPFYGGRTSAAAVHPKGLCKAISKGTARQARVDQGNLVGVKCTGEVWEVHVVQFEPESWMKYRDDVTGKELKAELVQAARAKELDTIRKM